MRLRATPEPGLRPGTDVGGFQIEKKLGMGAFGTVYRARRKKRVYALKLIARSGAGAWAEREVGVLLQLQHPHVARITSCGYWPEEEQLFFYVVTELVAGQPLDEWARRVRPTARQVARLVLTLARTLEEVHAAGVVHRDIKPVNILVREEDGQPVLVDFGAGGYENAPRLTVLLPPGTPEYRSPEALRFVRGEATDAEDHYQPRPSDDLWALGVVLYWLLTGELPFGDRSKADLHDAIRHRAPEPPHERNPRVPAALGQVCLRMLEKEPRARCKDAVEVGSALVAALAGADADWDVPLEAGWHSDAETELATSLPTRASDTLTPLRGLLPSRGPRLVLAGLVLFLSAFGLYRAVGNASPSAEVASTPLPTTSVSPLPPSWGRAIQEVAKEEPTPEVDAGAALPEEQPTPAPVAQATHEKEDRRVRLPEKKKRQQKQNGDVDAGTGPLRALQETVGRTVKAAGAAACLGAAACASGPAARSSPPPEE
ncbi:MAG TPA: serine/threonine-protein kinase, partial [Myxococcaceae bacterium]|nr:serine/threonine-protein kinase [Myxococcaceae bacterium]